MAHKKKHEADQAEAVEKEEIVNPGEEPCGCPESGGAVAADSAASEGCGDTGKADARDVSEEQVIDLGKILTEAQKAIAERDEMKDKMLRLAAEYDNFRKRSQREREQYFTEAKAGMVSEFLTVYDSLEIALKTETQDEAYKKGVEMTMRQLKDVFERLNVEEIKALGETFDPSVHNAVMHIEDENYGEKEIVEVFQTGFKIGERVVRFAMVKVAN